MALLVALTVGCSSESADEPGGGTPTGNDSTVGPDSSDAASTPDAEAAEPDGNLPDTTEPVVPEPANLAPRESGHLTFMSPHSKPIAVAQGLVLVANTPSNTLDIVHADSRELVRRVHVGIDPVSVAVRPDGSEAWVANHVSDSVSIVDLRDESPAQFQVIATVQRFAPGTGQTLFDEPVGVAFADDAKAYVALSSQNQIAIVDVASRAVTNTLEIPAQDPRAIEVRDGRLYVTAFESGNQTQISGCMGALDGELCTFDIAEHVINNNNILSLYADVDIVRHPDAPDRDLFVYTTSSDTLIDTVEGMGTLLYGLAVDSTGRVFVAQAEGRNDANGRASKGEGLAELQNRAFLNRITHTKCSAVGCGEPSHIELEPLPPENPIFDEALATPFAVRVSDDDSTLVATAASSHRVFTVDTESGEILGRVDVGAVPRGIALVSDADGAPETAWVLNAVDDSVSVVDVSDPRNPAVLDTVELPDPTAPELKLGRRLFHDAGASTTGTFSCESCHPDGHTDQLVWVLDTPICGIGDEPWFEDDKTSFVAEGCTQIQPRSTMPTRGLRDTMPFHWDGIPGDPYGGNNTANIYADAMPNCTDSHSCVRNLVDGSLGSTMCGVVNCPTNDTGQAGALSEDEREALTAFLLTIPYPPAQRRAYDNELSPAAVGGFQKFHIDGQVQGDSVNTCGDCHRMPFWVSTNTWGSGMDAPTWRGAYDRWLVLPQGRLNPIDMLEFGANPDDGIQELEVWQLSWFSDPEFGEIWNMVLEGSTGVSGAFGRHVTANQDTATDSEALALIEALERADEEGAVLLHVDGAFISVDGGESTQLDYDAASQSYRSAGETEAATFTREELLAYAQSGDFVGTFSGRMPLKVSAETPQPGIWTDTELHVQAGPQPFPTVAPDDLSMLIRGRHLEPDAYVAVDGHRVDGSVECTIGEESDCQALVVTLAQVPEPGMHFVQLQNPEGLMTNDFIFFAEAGEE